MAKKNLKISWSGAVLTKEDDAFFIEEFDSKGNSKGKWNLTEHLNNVVNQEGFKLSYDVTDELEPEM